MENWILEEIRNGENKNTSHEKIFFEISKKIFGGCKMIINDETVFFKEIEFYYNTAQHNDPFVHNECYQKELGLHLHNPGRGGIDLTFGDKDTYGGILIRGVQVGEIYYSGPWNVVKVIVNLLKRESDLKKEISTEEYNTFYDDTSLIDYVICKNDNQANEINLLRAPRVGLLCKPIGCDNKQNIYDEMECDYLTRWYRFVCDDVPGHDFQEKTIARQVTKGEIGGLDKLNKTKDAERHRLCLIKNKIEKGACRNP